MLRQRRLVSNKQSINQILNLYSNQNLQKITPKDYNCPSKNQPQNQTSRNNSIRTSLKQIQTNSNLTQSINSYQYVFESKRRLTSDKKCNSQGKAKTQEGFFEKISKIIETQDSKIQISQPNKVKSFLLVKSNRSYSSFSQRNKKSMDLSSLCQGQIFLQIDNKEETKVFQGIERMSTSRALMAFSKINRNYSSQKFKVKRDRHLYQGPIFLDTQKIIIQEKQRKLNNFFEKSLEKSISFSKTKVKQNKKNESKSRYKAEQDFQIGGWEHFQ